MQYYIRNIIETAECLQGIEKEIKDFHVAALFLRGLPECYDMLANALDA